MKYKRDLTVVLGLLIMAGIGWTTPATAKDPAVLRQKKKMSVSGKLIPLKDAVTVLRGTDKLKARLSRLYLGFSPAPGRSTRITRMEIKLELRKKGLRAGEHFSLKGAKETAVYRLSKESNAGNTSKFLSSLRHRISRYVNRKLDSSDLEVDINVMEIEYGGKSKPDARWKPEQIEARKPVFADMVPFTVRLKKEAATRPEQNNSGQQHGEQKFREQKFREWTISLLADVRISGPVLVPVRDLDQGDVVNPSDVKRTHRRFPTGSRPVMDPDTLGNRPLTTAVSKGEVLTRSVLKNPVLIKKGHMVRLTVRNSGGTTHLRLHEALESGSRGDRIQLKGPDGTKRTGIVKSRFHVETGPGVISKSSSSVQTGK